MYHCFIYYSIKIFIVQNRKSGNELQSFVTFDNICQRLGLVLLIFHVFLFSHFFFFKFFKPLIHTQTLIYRGLIFGNKCLNFVMSIVCNNFSRIKYVRTGPVFVMQWISLTVTLNGNIRFLSMIPGSYILMIGFWVQFKHHPNTS